MLITLAVVLIVNAVFSFAVWPTFLRRVANDPRARDAAGRPTRFLRVHQIIVGTALALALVSLVAAIVGLAAGA